MSGELINTLLILGGAQGLFLAVVLFTKHTNSVANRILAVAMVSYSFYILSGVYYTRGYYEAVPLFIGMSTPLVFLFGPIHYLYAQTVSAGGHTFRKSSLVHLLPFMLVTLYFVPFFLRSGAAKIEFLHALFEHGPPTDLAVIEQLQYPLGILYVILTIALLRRHRLRLQDNFSATEAINLLWLRNLTIAIALVWALATGLNLLEMAGVAIGGLEPSLTPLAVSGLVYGVGYFGLRQPEIFHGVNGRPDGRTMGRSDGWTATERRLGEGVVVEGAGRQTDGPSDGQTSALVEDEEMDASAPGYQRSGLTPEEAGALMQRLRHTMEQKQLYLRSQLTLQELAQELEISAHNLSEVINTQAGRNFYDFVNGYRVEEVMRRLKDPKHANLTILAVAADSGFNSKATFNAFFKRATGLTPSQYRKEQGTGT